jgi:hypothetical protein
MVEVDDEVACLMPRIEEMDGFVEHRLIKDQLTRLQHPAHFIGSLNKDGHTRVE